VLDSERSLFSAQLELVSARGDSYRSYVNLYRVLGGDWGDQAESEAVASRAPASAPERQP
jgi:outer membrane protein, multidrug efflux system